MGPDRDRADRKDAIIVAAAVIGFIAVVVAGVLLPMSRPLSTAQDVDLASAKKAVMLAEVHRDHPAHDRDLGGALRDDIAVAGRRSDIPQQRSAR